jgi:hypothetical protein
MNEQKYLNQPEFIVQDFQWQFYFILFMLCFQTDNIFMQHFEFLIHTLLSVENRMLCHFNGLKWNAMQTTHASNYHHNEPLFSLYSISICRLHSLVIYVGLTHKYGKVWNHCPDKSKNINAHLLLRNIMLLLGGKVKLQEFA